MNKGWLDFHSIYFNVYLISDMFQVLCIVYLNRPIHKSVTDEGDEQVNGQTNRLADDKEVISNLLRQAT